MRPDYRRFIEIGNRLFMTDKRLSGRIKINLEDLGESCLKNVRQN